MLGGYWRGFKACQLQMLVEGLQRKSLEDADPDVPLWDQVKQKLNKVSAPVGFGASMCNSCAVQSECRPALEQQAGRDMSAGRKAVPSQQNVLYHVLTYKRLKLTLID